MNSTSSFAINMKLLDKNYNNLSVLNWRILHSFRGTGYFLHRNYLIIYSSLYPASCPDEKRYWPCSPSGMSLPSWRMVSRWSLFLINEDVIQRKKDIELLLIEMDNVVNLQLYVQPWARTKRNLQSKFWYRYSCGSQPW